MKEINLTIGDWVEIEGKYTRRRWGIRSIIEKDIRLTTSTAPNKIGLVLSTIGVKDWSKKIDTIRNAESETTVRDLEAITDRRNLIAHAADRKGRGRTSANPEDIERQLETIKEIAAGIEEMLNEHEV